MLQHRPSTRGLALCLAGAALAAATASAPGADEFEDEAAYLAALATHGYAALAEDFEGPDWDHVRSDYPEEHSAPFVTSKGITWTGNAPISTNQNWGRFGTWGIYTVYVPPGSPDELTVESERTLYAVGGWINGNPDFGADLAIEIDGVIVAERNIGAGHQFLGVIVSTGFTTARFVDLEQQTAWGADDFTFGFAACAADVDDSGAVDVQDLLAVLGAWDELGGPADVDGDGVVGVGDLLEVLANWGPCG